VKADDYRRLLDHVPEGELKRFENYLVLLRDLDPPTKDNPGCQMKKTARGTYLVFSDASVLLLGRARIIDHEETKP